MPATHTADGVQQPLPATDEEEAVVKPRERLPAASSPAAEERTAT